MDDYLLIITATIVTCIVLSVGIVLQAFRAERPRAANDNPWDVTAITIAILGPGLWAAAIGGAIWLGSIWS